MGIQRRAGRLLGAALLGSAAISVHAAPLHAFGTANASSVIPSGGTASSGKGRGKGNGNNASTGWNDLPNDNAAAPASPGSVSTEPAAGAGSGPGIAAAPDSGGVTYAADAYNGLAAANDFYGLVSGNDSQGSSDLGLGWGSGWTLAAKDNVGSGDDVSNEVLGLTFSVDAGPRAATGHWTLKGLGLGSGALLLDMVAALKSGNEYGLYYFHDVVFDGSGGGTWLSPAFNVNGVRQDLSHLSIYLRSAPDGGFGSSPQGGLSDAAGGLVPAPQGNAVPEPGSLALVGAALGAMAALRRRAARRKRRHGAA